MRVKKDYPITRRSTSLKTDLDTKMSLWTIWFYDDGRIDYVKQHLEVLSDAIADGD